jgi:integrase
MVSAHSQTCADSGGNTVNPGGKESMSRHQAGYIFESQSGVFYVRYRVVEFIDGKAERVQKSHMLARKDEKHFSRTCKAVKLLRDEFMKTVNRETNDDSSDMRVVDFWDKFYLPFIENNMRASTMHGYQQIWNQHLRTHFGELTLQNYRTPIGSQFLLSLTKSQGRRTLNHIRSLASGIFTHALNMGYVESNPWASVKILGKVTEPKQTAHYTLEEIENIVSALVEHVNCQLMICLSFFAGLRPSEIAGLRWEDFDERAVNIRRAIVNGVVDVPKTLESIATLPLVDQILVPLALWRAKCGNPTEGWLFTNERGKPQDLKDVIRRIVRPTLQDAGLKWKGLYAGRRGVATTVIGLTNGNYAAAQELLRHKNMGTTLQFYKKKTQNALTDGLKALEAAASVGKDTE